MIYLYTFNMIRGKYPMSLLDISFL